MVHKNNSKKPVIIGVGVVIVIVIIAVIGFMMSKDKKTLVSPSNEMVLPDVEPLPTVSADVQVNLVPIKNNQEVELTIEKIPSGTQNIEYELSYLAKGNLPKGVIGSIATDGDDSITRKITLGTCSSGRCVYDQGVERVKVILKFSSDTGESVFEKEFDL